MEKHNVKTYSQSTYIPSPSLNVKSINVSIFYLFVKRLIDIVASILLLILTSPIFFIISMIYLFGDSKGPLFFKQQRYGKNGSLIDVYKFRSMIMNADEKLRNNEELYRKYIENNYKLEPYEDPRITKLGRILRNTSLDEFPQLLNVLKGEMSLVGPRPIVKEELVEYKNRKEEFLSVKPGITGYWQVKGRSNIGYPERVEFELHYIKHQSLLLDLKILLQTIVVIFTKKGAY